MTLGVWGGKQTDEVVLPGLSDFMDETGVQVLSTGDGTRDRLAKIRSHAGVDVALLPVNEVVPLLAEGLILPTDESIANYEYLREDAKIDGGYGTSLLAGIIVYNPEFIPEPPDSWLDFLNPAYAGHVSIGNVPGAPGYAILAMVNRALGGTDDDLTPALEAFGKAASEGQFLYLTDFGPSIEPLVNSGDIWFSSGIAGQMEELIANDLPLKIVIPKEGPAAMMNVAVIPADTQNVGCAKALVSALLSKPVQERYATGYFYHPTVTNVEVPYYVADRVLPNAGQDLVTIDWHAIGAKTEEIVDYFNKNIAGAVPQSG